MPAKKDYKVEFNEQSVRFVFEHIEVDESRHAACRRLGPKLNVKAVTLYIWAKIATPKPSKPAAAAGSVEDLKAQLAEVRTENRELARANQILRTQRLSSGRRSTVDPAAVLAEHSADQLDPEPLAISPADRLSVSEISEASRTTSEFRADFAVRVQPERV